MKTKTASQKKIWLLCIIAVLSLLCMTVALCVPKEPKVIFTPPAFESAAVKGVPVVSAELGYSELYRDGMAYRVALCADVQMEGNDAVFYFTNPRGNDAWLKLRVLDANGMVLGETGLLKPGQYVRSATLADSLPVGTPIQLKVMGYEPNTYYSIGALTIDTVVNRHSKMQKE